MRPLIFAIGFGAACALGSTLPVSPAQALAIVHASANSGVESASSDIPQNLEAEPHLSARARASAVSSSANVVAGPLPGCGAPGQGCATLSNPPEAGAYASANGLNGTLKVGAQASDGGNARASATATLIDSITLTNTAINIRLDINAFGAGNAQSPGQTQGDATLFFSMFFNTPSPNLDDPQRVFLFAIEVSEDAADKGYFAFLRDDPDLVVASGSSVPGNLEFTIDLADPVFADLFTGIGPLPGQFDLAGPLPLGFALSVSADCDSDNCYSQARADESLYIKLSGTSANGYSYPGFVPGTDPGPDPDPVGVMEPGTLLALIPAVLGLALVRTRRRQS